MTFHSDDRNPVNWIAAGVAIGLAGGLAEVLVVGAYAGVAGVDAENVAGAIATAVRVDPGSAIVGLAVHMAMAAGLGKRTAARSLRDADLRAGAAGARCNLGPELLCRPARLQPGLRPPAAVSGHADFEADVRCRRGGEASLDAGGCRFEMAALGYPCARGSLRPDSRQPRGAAPFKGLVAPGVAV